MMIEQCNTCRFSRFNGPPGTEHDFADYQQAQCRRHGPIVNIITVTTHPSGYQEAPVATWPLVQGKDWCGDWELK